MALELRWQPLLIFLLALISPSQSFALLCPAARGSVQSKGCRAQLQYDVVSTDHKFSGSSGESGQVGSASHSRIGVAISWRQTNSAWYFNFSSSELRFSPIASGENILPSSSASGSDFEIGWRKLDRKRFTYAVSAGTKSQVYVSALNATSLTLSRSDTPFIQLSGSLALFTIRQVSFVSSLRAYYLLGSPPGNGYALDLGINIPIWSIQLGLLFGIGKKNNDDSFKNSVENQWLGASLSF